MKTKEEIERLAESNPIISSYPPITEDGIKFREAKKQMFIEGYIECQKDFSNSWTKGCNCGEERIGETWCCNVCGLPTDTREFNKKYTKSDMLNAFCAGSDFEDGIGSHFGEWIDEYNKYNS